MSLSAIWKLTCLVTPDGQLNQISNLSLDPGMELLLIRGDAKQSPQFGAVAQQKPKMSFTSSAIKRVLDITTAKGKAYATATTAYLAKKASGGHFATGAVHGSLAFPACLIVPRTLRASQGKEATIDVDLFALSANGTTAAITATIGSVALPTFTAADQAYTLGPASINGSALGGIDDLEINFGIGEKIIVADGQVWPVFGCVDTIVSSIRCRTWDPTLLATAAAGLAQGATPSTIYLRQKSNEGANVADATAGHIKFTLTTAGIFQPTGISGADEGDAQMEIVWNPLDDGVNDLLAMSTASAIT